MDSLFNIVATRIFSGYCREQCLPDATRLSIRTRRSNGSDKPAYRTPSLKVAPAFAGLRSDPRLDGPRRDIGLAVVN